MSDTRRCDNGHAKVPIKKDGKIDHYVCPKCDDLSDHT
jgi:hypothetical protein